MLLVKLFAHLHTFTVLQQCLCLRMRPSCDHSLVAKFAPSYTYLGHIYACNTLRLLKFYCVRRRGEVDEFDKKKLQPESRTVTIAVH